ncbi:MAG: hypothetical protein IIZ36_00405 [Ruminococcus sp.]|nr:hypothetical protein [Ruminococcus sp.]
MKICKSCAHVAEDNEARCSFCGGKTAEIKDNNTPVYLISASGFECDRIVAALEDSGIPCFKKNRVISNHPNPMGMNVGLSDIMVPYSALDDALAVCENIGAGVPDDGKNQTDNNLEADLENPPEPEKQSLEEEEMSEGKKRVVRILSAIAFFILVALVVYGTDFITGWIKGLFS